MFRIVPWVARDRVISTVDGEARDGHKSRNRRFDGDKTHVSVDPDSELIDEVVVTPANTHDADAVDDLLADMPTTRTSQPCSPTLPTPEPTRSPTSPMPATRCTEAAPASNRGGRFSKDDFSLDVDAGMVACPAGPVVTIRFGYMRFSQCRRRWSSARPKETTSCSADPAPHARVPLPRPPSSSPRRSIWPAGHISMPSRVRSGHGAGRRCSSTVYLVPSTAPAAQAWVSAPARIDATQRAGSGTPSSRSDKGLAAVTTRTHNERSHGVR